MSGLKEAPPRVRYKPAQLTRARLIDIRSRSHAAGDDPVAGEAVAEAGVKRTQAFFAQHRAMRLNQWKGRIIADRPDIAEMVGNAFQFRDQGA